MDDYRRQIDRLISKSDGEVLLNGSVSHAAMVIERMLSRAHEQVLVMTRNLDPLIYCDDVTSRAALNFVRSGKTFKILIDEYDDKDQRDRDNPYFSQLLKLGGGFELRQVPEGLRDSIALNFAVMDDRGFRIEKDETGATAVVSFGNKSMADRLVALFESVWSSAKAIRELA